MMQADHRNHLLLDGRFNPMDRESRYFVRMVPSVALCLLSTQSLLGQPSNNDCSSAFPVGDGQFMASNVGATTDGTASCGFLNRPGDKDIWWKFTAPSTGMTTIDTCGSAAGLDTVLNVFDACGGVELACNDDQLQGGCGSVLPVTLSRLEFPVEAGTAYWIRVAEYRGRTGVLVLNISTEGSVPFCGDGICNDHEDICSCPVDGCGVVCGDRCCSTGESQDTCPSDCAGLADFADFQVCFTGPISIVDEACTIFDHDEDQDIELDDYGYFIARAWESP